MQDEQTCSRPDDVRSCHLLLRGHALYFSSLCDDGRDEVLRCVLMSNTPGVTLLFITWNVLPSQLKTNSPTIHTTEAPSTGRRTEVHNGGGAWAADRTHVPVFKACGNKRQGALPPPTGRCVNQLYQRSQSTIWTHM